MTNDPVPQEDKPGGSKLLRCILVDDEEYAREMLKRILAKYTPFAEVVAEAESVNGAVQAIATESPDVVFLDIEIIGGTGFDVLDRVRTGHFITVFTTEHENCRAESGRYQNVRFVLKPISISVLNEVLRGFRGSATLLEGDT